MNWRPLFSLTLFILATATFAAEDFVLPEFDDMSKSSQKVESKAAVESNDDEVVPANFTPIEAGSTGIAKSAAVKSPANSAIASQAIESKPIPAELNRPIRVGVYTDVKELYLIRGGEEIRITAAGNKLKFQGKENSMEVEAKEIYDEGTCIAIAPDKKSLKSACYPGYFSIAINKGKLNAINVVDIEEYIRGVIPYEIGKLDSSRFEALKAQAVAARTYAYKHFGSRESLGFDVFADTKDQVYKGLQSATSLTDSAVKETAGEAMTYDGAFITAYYHSTCGGETEVMATWNKEDIPYLRSKPDLREDGTPWCNESSYSTWERKYSDAEVQKMAKENAGEVKAKIKDFTKVTDIVIKDTLPSGRILTMEVITDKGSFEIVSDKTRWLFKNKGVILPSSFFRISRDGDNWILSGKGFGHGVGMCQMGVRARAQAGQKYDEILKHYYTGITIQRFER